MCGIAGIFGKQANENLLRELLFPIAHRGEVDYRNEMLVLPGMGIGTHRLAIVDEASGKQPVQAIHEQVFCVFNGEIYNHAELRRELMTENSFISECDSEVVLHAYLKWGDKFVEYLDGKFGIAIVDLNKDTLVLARDRMGIKPLYYTELNNNWLFSSELKSFATFKDEDLNIIELDPGCIWRNGKTTSYFNLKQFSKEEISDSELTNCSIKLKNCLTAAVQKRIPKESPKIASLLSGGVDSSIITYLARQLHPKVVAYTLSAPHMSSADLIAAKTFCQEFDIEHIIVSPSVEEMQQFYLDYGVYMTESFEPVLVRNAVSYHFLCRQVVKDGFKYCLNGEGADELFGGYDFVKEVPIHLQDSVIWHSLSIIHKTYLQMADRASMYATLEARVPFMDKDLVDFCLLLPPNARVNGKDNKFLLRDAFKNELPESIAYRRKTGMNEGAGFGVNASTESIYHNAVRIYYENHAVQYKEDLALCKAMGVEGKLDLSEIEEIYNFARFARLNFTKLKHSQNRLQLNTKLQKKLVTPLQELVI